MEPVIEIKNLTKDYGQGRGIFDVSFSVNKGECFGFLGPNGAGKSTTIRHLMGFSVPDSGETLINGVNSLRDRDITMQGVYACAVEEEMARLYGKGIGILYTIDGSPFLYDNRHTAIEHLTHLADKKVWHLVGLPV